MEGTGAFGQQSGDQSGGIPPEDQPGFEVAAKKPSATKWVLIGVVLMLLGVVGGCAGGLASVLGMITTMSDGQQFKGPGEATLSVTEAGDALVYHEVTGVYDGQAFSTSSPTPPNGVSVEVFGPDGATVPVEMLGGNSMQMNVNETLRIGLASFDAPTPGDYRVVVTGGPEEVYFASEHGMETFLGDMVMVFVSVGFGVLFLVLGIVVIVVGVARTSAKRKAAPMAPVY